MATIHPLPVADPESRLADLVIAEIYAAGWADGQAAMAARPRLRLVTLDDSTAATVTAIRAASS